MTPHSEQLPEIKRRVALIAHDNRKQDLLEWARFNRGTLASLQLFGTGTTGRLIREELGLEVHCCRASTNASSSTMERTSRALPACPQSAGGRQASRTLDVDRSTT